MLTSQILANVEDAIESLIQGNTVQIGRKTYTKDDLIELYEYRKHLQDESARRYLLAEVVKKMKLAKQLRNRFGLSNAIDYKTVVRRSQSIWWITWWRVTRLFRK